MELELHIVRDPYGGLTKQRVRVFGEAGGSVGRALDNYWLLPDPGCFLSGHHCDITFRDGAFWVRDTSRNGVFINGAMRPLGPGSAVRVADGDVLTLATYRVQARLRTRGNHASSPIAPTAPPGQLISPEELFAPVEQGTKVEVPSQTHVEPAANNSPSPSVVTSIIEPMLAPPSPASVAQAALQPAHLVEPTGEHEQLPAADGESTAAACLEMPTEAAPQEAFDAEPQLTKDTAPELASEPDLNSGLDAVAESVVMKPVTDSLQSLPSHDSDPQTAPPIESTGEHQQQPEPEASTADEQPADLLATRIIDPALIAGELPRVIHIDRERLRAEGHLPPESLERLIANQFRHIKRPLIKNAFGKGAEPVQHGHLVMVTSSLPGEGKTFSSINLAFSLAREKGLQVVVVDADVAKQHVSRIFGIHESPGLLNALADETLDVDSLILPTDVKGLSILPSGQCAEEDVATELLASSRMDEINTRISARSAHQIVLFDSPPLLLTNESRVLASLMGQILLVVRAGVTPQQAVSEAIGYLEEEKPIGLVLNQSKSHTPGSYYGYGAYGYGVYGANEGESGYATKRPGGKEN